MAGVLQAMVLGEVELSGQSVYTAAMVICEAMPRESELHCEPSRNPILEMTLSTAVSPALVPRGGDWLYDLAKIDARWSTFFQGANKNVMCAMETVVEKGRRDLPPNVPGASCAKIRRGQPTWLDGLKAVMPNSWYYGETSVWAPLRHLNPIREVVSCTTSSLRCAPYLVHNPNADTVENVTSMDTHSCVRASDEALERWVAKQLLIEESDTGIPVPEGLTVLAYLINSPQHAAQWGRHMTRKGSLNLSVYMYDACRGWVSRSTLWPNSREDAQATPHGFHWRRS